MKIDIGKLKNAHQTLKDQELVTIAQCPVCAEAGRDLHNQDHLIIYPDGRFGCAVNTGEDGAEHRRDILRLVGTDDEPNAGDVVCQKRLRRRPINPFPPKITYITLNPVDRREAGEAV
jgi:hypothetical protein